MSSLIRRLAALEARQPASGSDEARAAVLAGAVRALMDAAESRHSSPGMWDKGRSGRVFLLALLVRLDAATETEGDRAMLAALPACHLPPPVLVRALCSLL